jgi:hypothetical protein
MDGLARAQEGAYRLDEEDVGEPLSTEREPCMRELISTAMKRSVGSSQLATWRSSARRCRVHLSLRATDARARQAWHETLRLVQERHPLIVVAGHKNHPDLPDTADVLAFNQAYLAEFDLALAASHSAGELTAAMKRKFPAAGLDRILSVTAARFFPN